MNRKFPALAACRYAAIAHPLQPIMVEVPHTDKFVPATPQEVTAAGIRIPANHEALIFPWDLSENPPLSEMRPKEEGPLAIFRIGMMSVQEDRTVCALFTAMGKDPKHDMVMMLNAQQVCTSLAHLQGQLASKQYKGNRAYDESLVQMLEPTASLLMATEARLFPRAAGVSLQ